MARIKTSIGEVSMKIKMPKLHNPGWRRGVSRVLIFTMVLSAFMHQGWYSPKPASAVTYFGEGTLAYGTSSLTPGYPGPGSIVANDLLVLVIGMKPNTAGSGNSSVTTPTGWTALTPVYGTTGSLGGDTGPTNLFAFYRNAAGGETGTLSVTTSGANSAWAQMYKFTSNTAWSVAQATGEDTSGGAAVSIAFGADPGVQSGDYILAAMCIPTDVGVGNQFSAQAFSQAGVTFGTVTEISEPYRPTGNDVGGFVVIADIPFNSGSSSGNPTMTATAGGTTTNVYGPGVFIRIRETNPPVPGTVTLSPDTGTYTSGSPTITTVFREDSYDVTGCEYTTNGSTWTAGTLTGARPSYTCTATPTGLSGSVTINMRATSTDGTGTATALTRTADGTAPADGTLTVTPGVDQNALSWTAATDSGSGLRTVNTYDVRAVSGSTLPADCASGLSVYTGTATSYTHANLVPAAGGYSYRVCAYDNVNNASAGATGTGLPTWGSTVTCSRCHGDAVLFPDGTDRNIPAGTFVGTHTTHAVKLQTACSTCHVNPASNAHRNGTIEMQTSIASGSYSRVSPIDQGNPVGTPATGTCTNISCHGANNPTPQWGVGTAGCVDCHAGTITRVVTSGTLSNVVAEFGLAWGHKKTGRGPVTNADCIVCHLEGNYATQKPSSYHMDGNIDLRDPDGVGETAITNVSGGTFTFTKFATSYAAGSRTTTGHLSDNIDNVLTQKFCLACHDSNGATNPTARTPGGTAFMSWGGVDLGPNYTVGKGAAAAGGVIDAKTQFATTNSSVHPVRGPRNKDFATPARFNAPYNNFTRPGTSGTRTEGVVMNCFDCHNISGASPLTSRTVAAHGNAETIRGNIWTNPNTLCQVCHAGYNTGSSTHGSGSALSSSTNNGMTTYLNERCHFCHSRHQVDPARPARAADYHGFNSLAGGALWPTINARPYAFIRNTAMLNYHDPKTSPERTETTASCSAPSVGVCNDTMGQYTAGGTY